MKSLSLVAVLLLLAACASSTEKLSWRREAIVGHTLNIVDETRIESYRFHVEGHAIAHIGVKGGPVAGPVVDWKIETGRLIISDGGRIRRELTLVAKERNELVTQTRWGRTIRWTLSRDN
jgi:hypothetical protein